MTGRPPTPSSSPFYDREFVARKPRAATGDDTPPRPFHVSRPCAAAYARGCRCDPCRQAWRESVRRRRGNQPSKLAVEVVRLNQELDAAEAHIDALREENAMLRARLTELEWTGT